MKKHKKIIVVDEQDNEIGTMDLQEAIYKGLIRRVARVFVFNESGQLLLQRRSTQVFDPLLLDQSAAGHVDAGETYYQAAVRELKEEIGLDPVGMNEVVSSYFEKPYFYSSVYRMTVSDETGIRYDSEEIAEVFWISIAELDTKMQECPELFTTAFYGVWTALHDKIIAT